MAGRLMELAIAIKGKLDASYTASMQKALTEAGNLQRRLGDTSRAMRDAQKAVGGQSLGGFSQNQRQLLAQLDTLKKVQSDFRAFADLKRSVGAMGASFDQAKAKTAALAAEFRKSQASTAQLKAQLEQAKNAMQQMKGKVPAAEYRAARAAVKELTAAYKESQTQTRALGASFEAAKRNAAGMKGTLSEQRAALQAMRASLANAGYSTQNLSQNEIRLRGEIQRTTQALRQAAREQERLAAQRDRQTAQRENHRHAQQNLFNATANWQAGFGAVQTVISPLTGAIETAANFEQAMAKVKAITRSSDVEMQNLTATARAMGEKTQFSASQAAEAMSYLGMAGWKSEQIISGLPGLLDLAAAGGTDLARTADIISDDLTAFGMSADKAGHMADVFAYTITNTNTNVEMLGETMKYAAPVAHLFGASLEETAALAGLMANSGIKASQAGTSLRAGFLRLAGPPKKASKELNALGVDLDSLYTEQREAAEGMKALGIDMEKFADGPGKMGKILTELKEKTAGMGQEQKMAALGAIFGTTAVSGWLAVLQSSPEDFNAFVKALENSDGEAARMAQIMQNTAKGALTRLKSATESAAISVGSVFLPMLANAADAAAKWAGALAQAAAEHPRLIQMLGILTAALAAVVMTALTINVATAAWNLLASTAVMVKGAVLGAQTAFMAWAAAQRAAAASTVASIAAQRTAAATAVATAAVQRGVATATGLWTAAQWALNAAMAANPVGLVVVAIVALIGIIALAVANIDSLKATASITFNHISGTVAAMVAKVQAKFSEALNKITDVWNSITGQSLHSSEIIGEIFNTLGFLLGGAFDVAVTVIGTNIAVIINTVVSLAQIIGGVVNIIVGIFTGDWDRAWKGAGQVVDGVVGASVGTLKTWMGGIGDVFDTLMGKSAEVQKQAEQAKASQDVIAAGRNALPQINSDYMPDEGMMQTAAAAQQTSQATAEAATHAQELSANVQQTGQATQVTTDYMQQLQTVVGQVPAQAGAAFSDMGEQSAAAAQAINTNMQQIPAQTQATFEQLPPMAQQGTDAMVQEFSQLATKCQPGGNAFVQGANDWGQRAHAAIATWAEQMASTVENKLSSAWGRISSQFSAGLNVNVTTSGGASIAANATGGIYRKGAFLTTFAEDSAEAAIPLDGSSRAISLWRQAGEMLGVLPKNMPGILPPDINTTAELAAPPTEAQVAAAPVAREPYHEARDVKIEYKPTITIQGGAGSEVVHQIQDILSQGKDDLKALVLQVLREQQIKERRTSFA